MIIHQTEDTTTGDTVGDKAEDTAEDTAGDLLGHDVKRTQQLRQSQLGPDTKPVIRQSGDQFIRNPDERPIKPAKDPGDPFS